MDAERDFFVSYNSADRAWAEWTAWQLEDAGHTTVLQDWDFVPGSNFVVEMDRATKRAKRTIAILSPDYLSASFPQPEWGAAFARDPEGLRRKLVPLRVRECDVRGLLGQIVYIDLVGLDEGEARARLLAGVRDRLKPLEAPSFPGGVPHSQSKPPSFPGENAQQSEVAVPSASAPAGGIWVKLNEFTFAVDELDDEGTRIRLSSHLDETVARRLEALRQSGFGSPQVRLVYGDRVVDGQLTALRRTTRRGATETTIELARVEPMRATALRAGTTGMSADDVVEAGVRNLLFREPLPARLDMLESLADPGIDRAVLERAFALPDAEAEQVVRLVLAEGLIGSGNAAAILFFQLGPRRGDQREVVLEWEEPRVYTNVGPGRRRIEGIWRVPASRPEHSA
jgi:hypothetical protein